MSGEDQPAVMDVVTFALGFALTFTPRPNDVEPVTLSIVVDGLLPTRVRGPVCSVNGAVVGGAPGISILRSTT